MAERITQPTDADKLNWNSDGVTYPPTPPNAAKRLTGFKPKDVPAAGPGETITADEQNWLHGLSGQMMEYFLDYLVREWNQIAQGIAATSYTDLFRVFPPVGSVMYIRLAQVFSFTGTAATGGNVTSVCGDGEQVYYISGSTSQSLIAANPNGGTEIWEASPIAGHTAICTDGLNVYAMSPFSPAELGLHVVNRTTGALINSGGVEYACQQLRANGVYCVGIAPNSGAGKVVFYTVATPTETGTVTPTTQLNGVAIDHDQCYVGGVRSTYDVWAYTLSTRANAWQVTLDTNAPTVNAICADGDFVYVCTDDFVTALPGTPNRCLFCLDRLNGTILWSMDLGADLDACAVDDDYLYVTTAGGVAYAIRLRSGMAVGSVGVVATQTNVAAAGGLYVDGMSLYCQDGAAATKLRRLATAQKTKDFMRVNGQDPARRPFYNLAIPRSNP
jgi:outer membrane protein assembly factor BamB